MRRHSLTRVGYSSAHMRAVRKKRACTGALPQETRAHTLPLVHAQRERTSSADTTGLPQERNVQRTTTRAPTIYAKRHACASFIIRKKRPAHIRAAQSLGTTSHRICAWSDCVWFIAPLLAPLSTLVGSVTGPHGASAHTQVHSALRCGGESAVGDGAPTPWTHSVRGYRLYYSAQSVLTRGSRLAPLLSPPQGRTQNSANLAARTPICCKHTTGNLLQHASGNVHRAA